MRRTLGALVLAAVMVVAATGCEPKMTITATPDPMPLADSISHIQGSVTPASATPKVFLQRTVGGKWVDWKSCPATGCDGATPTRMPAANVNKATGTYSIAYPVQWCGVVLHLRVRSAGGGSFSPGFYTQADPYEAC